MPFTDLLLYADCNFESLRFYAKLISVPDNDADFNAAKLTWEFPTNATNYTAMSYKLATNTSLEISNEDLYNVCEETDCVLLVTALKEKPTSQYWQ